MKLRLSIIAVAALLSACGYPERWDSLPVGVQVYGDAKLEQNTAMAIASLNAGLGVVVFAIGEGAITVTQAFGVGEAETVYGTAVYDGGALIHSCNIEVEQAIHGQDADIRNALLIAHELFHCLGFGGHSINADSLMTDHAIPCGAGVDPEMVAMFSDKYPEVVQ